MAIALWTHGLLRQTFAPAPETASRGAHTSIDALAHRDRLSPRDGRDNYVRIHSLREREIWTTSEPVLITCFRGTLWITSEYDAIDHILRAGESWASLSNAHVVAQAINAAALAARPL